MAASGFTRELQSELESYMESAREEDIENILPDDEDSDIDVAESRQESDEMEDMHEAIDPEKQDKLKSNISAWLSTSSSSQKYFDNDQEKSILHEKEISPTPPPSPILSKRFGMSPVSSPLFCIPEEDQEGIMEKEEISSTTPDAVASLSLTTNSDSIAIEADSVLEVTSTVADRMEQLQISYEILQDEEDLLMANTNKQFKPFRDPPSTIVKESCMVPEEGESRSASLSAEEIRRKVATSFRKRTVSSSVSYKGKNQSKSRSARNHREIIKTSTIWG